MKYGINPWSPCECGGEPKIIQVITVDEITCLLCKCKKCGQHLADVYEITYRGRHLYTPEAIV